MQDIIEFSSIQRSPHGGAYLPVVWRLCSISCWLKVSKATWQAARPPSMSNSRSKLLNIDGAHESRERAGSF
jgi:hypothetical protein